MTRSARLSLGGWLLLAAYRLVGAAVVAGLRIARLLGGARIRGLQTVNDRLALWTEDREIVGALRGGVWIHAASVGEVIAARPLVSGLRDCLGGTPVLLTCNTSTGKRVAGADGTIEVRYLPIDSRPVVRRIIAAMKPALFIFVETEIWPVLLLELQRERCPTVMYNARVSSRSYPRYRLISALMRPVLRGVSAVLARDESSAARLTALGAVGVQVIGDTKYDGGVVRDGGHETDLLSGLADDRPVLLAVSTHEGEEEVVIAAFRRLDGARLVLAPRHPERCARVEKLLGELGLSFNLWSRDGVEGNWTLLLLDTVGQLRGFMRGACAAFVGGSLVDVGGHNLLEPAAFSLPICCGPRLANVEAQARELEGVGALRIVDSADSLAAEWSELIGDPVEAQRRGRAARRLIEEKRGALARGIQAINAVMESGR